MTPLGGSRRVGWAELAAAASAELVGDLERARAALAALKADLLAQGWERMRRAPGTEWYELRFRREETASLLRPAPRLSEQRAVRLAASTTPARAQATPRVRRSRLQH